MVSAVNAPPVADRAAPVGASVTWAVTGVDGNGVVAEPKLTVAHLIHSTSIALRSVTLLKLTVRIGEAAVMFEKLMDGEPEVAMVPPASVKKAAQSAIFRPDGMLLKTTCT